MRRRQTVCHASDEMIALRRTFFYRPVVLNNIVWMLFFWIGERGGELFDTTSAGGRGQGAERRSCISGGGDIDIDDHPISKAAIKPEQHIRKSDQSRKVHLNRDAKRVRGPPSIEPETPDAGGQVFRFKKHEDYRPKSERNARFFKQWKHGSTTAAFDVLQAPPPPSTSSDIRMLSDIISPFRLTSPSG